MKTITTITTALVLLLALLLVANYLQMHHLSKQTKAAINHSFCLGVNTGYKAALAGVKRLELDAAVELMLEEKEKTC